MIENNKFYAVDLFAGCGGLSEGFRQAGFDIIGQIEMDKWACETLITRHLYYELRKINKTYLYNKYLRKEMERKDILNRFPGLRESILNRVINATFGKDETEHILNRIESSKEHENALKIHVLLSGPPCQPYSIAGRARDPFRMEKDSRHHLYRHYLEIIESIQPDIFVYENVPGLFTAKSQGEKILVRILNDFCTLNPRYEITPPLEQIYTDPCSYVLNSVDFHIPQNRKRLFLIGYKKSLECKNPEIKLIFNKIQKVALRNRKKGYLTVDDAIGDLPHLKPGEGSDEWYGLYNSNSILKYYQKKMRKLSPGILNHKARLHMKSDLERYKFFINYHKNWNKDARLNDLMRERHDLIPNHKHLDKFFDRFRVQRWSRPSSTVTAHICKDGHYYIHPDINQCRSFTVREAARCQSFPDNFKFEGPKTRQFRQAGNAVPPRLAKLIAKFILKELNKIYDE